MPQPPHRTGLLRRALGYAALVLLIAGLFFALALGAPRLSDLMAMDSTDIAKAKCREYYDSAREWTRFHALPGSLAEMQAPRCPGEEDFLKVEDDPWGSPYVLERKGDDVRVYSRGPDGRKGTSDDIAWPR